MSITESAAQDFFVEVPDSAYWDDPQALPTFLVPEYIDRLTEDEIDDALHEVEDAYTIEAMIWGMK